MTGEETIQIRNLIRKSPRTIWGYWPFVFPVLIVVVGVLAQIVIFAYLRHKMPDFEVLLKRGAKVEPMWDSAWIQKAVAMITLSITVTFILLAFLARLAFRQVTLLKAAASDLGIVDGRSGRREDCPPGL